MTISPENLAASHKIIKQHEFAFFDAPDGAVLIFGLFCDDGKTRFFNIHSKDLPSFSIEIRELAIGAKFFSFRNKKAQFSYTPSFLPQKQELHPNGDLDYFQGPILKLHRALVLIQDLDDLITKYSKRVTITAEPVDQDEKNTVWKIVYSEQPPAMISLILGDIIHNLRSSLDLTVCDIARSKNRPTSDLGFPFAKNETAFRQQMIKKKEIFTNRLGQEVVNAIMELRPYITNGNVMLRALHDLNIEDKHKLIIPTYFAARQSLNIPRFISDAVTSSGQTSQHSNSIADFEVIASDLFFKEGELVSRSIGENPLEYFLPAEIPMQVRFSSGSIAFAGEPVMEKIVQLYEVAHNICADFKERFSPE